MARKKSRIKRNTSAIELLINRETLKHKPTEEEITKWEWELIKVYNIKDFINKVLKNHFAFSLANCSKDMDKVIVEKNEGGDEEFKKNKYYNRYRRRGKNYISNQLLGLDFDSGITKEEVKAILKKHNIKYSLIYNSPSYGIEGKEKFRVLFFLDKPCYEYERIRNALCGLIYLFDIEHEKGSKENGADKKCKDPVRYFNPPLGKEGIDSIELYDRKADRCFIKLDNLIKILEKIGYNPYSFSIDTSRKMEDMPTLSFTEEELCKNCRALDVVLNCEIEEIKTWEHSYFIVETLAPLLSKLQDTGKYRGSNETSMLSTLKKAVNNIIVSGVNRIGSSSITGYYNPKAHTDFIKRRIDGGLPPNNCTSDCKYYKGEGCILKNKDSNNLYRALEQLKLGIITHKGINQKEQTLEKARDKTKEVIYSALNSNGVNVVVAPPGTGKSTITTNFINENQNYTYLIVLPTHKLAEDSNFNKYPKIPLNPIASYSNKDKDIEQQVKEIYKQYQIDLGLGSEGKERLAPAITKMKEDLKELGLKDLIKDFDDYQTEKSKILKENSIIVTTHARYALEGERLINNLKSHKKPIKVIIDEDIRNEFLKVSSINIKGSKIKNKLNKLSKQTNFCNAKPNKKKNKIAISAIQTELAERAKLILDVLDNKDKLISLPKIKDSDVAKGGIKDILYDRGIKLSDDILKLLIDSKRVLRARGELFYLTQNKLPDVDTVILTATPSPKAIMELISNNVAYHNVGKIKTREDLSIVVNQEYSYSKNGINKNYSKVVDIAESTIKEWNKDKTLLITFKEVEDRLKSDLGLAHSLHIGNVQGYNDFIGFNILWVGTPYPNPAYIRLLGEELGITDEEKYKLKRNKKSKTLNINLETSTVKIANFMTYDDEKLRDIQVNYMTKEIIQGVGRSRIFDLKENINIQILSNINIVDSI